MKVIIIFLFVISNLYSGRFEIINNAVYDKSTKLFWKNIKDRRTLIQAKEYCKKIGWRLPKIDELKSIVDYNKSYPAIATNSLDIIINGNTAWYWSITALNSNNIYYWVINFKEGYACWINQDEQNYLLCVKGR